MSNIIQWPAYNQAHIAGYDAGRQCESFSAVHKAKLCWHHNKQPKQSSRPLRFNHDIITSDAVSMCDATMAALYCFSISSKVIKTGIVTLLVLANITIKATTPS
eukprot:scaffold398741_cov23-Prasinocladus_malaysianus.AAC.1